VGTIISVKVALEAEGGIKTRKRRSLETKTKRLLDGWTLEDVSNNVKYKCNNLHLARKDSRIFAINFRQVSSASGGLSLG